MTPVSVSWDAGVTWDAVVSLAASVTLHVFGVALAAAAALTPDLDHPEAKGVRRLGVVGLGLSHGIRGVSRLTTGVSHRGLTHSLAFAGLLGGLTYLATGLLLPDYAARYLGCAVAAGVVAALLGDLVTRRGLQHLLWPLPWVVEWPRMLRFTTGKGVEKYVVFPAVLVTAVAGVLEWFGLTSATLEVLSNA
jgi:inner membrane protein